jgi:His-Xaa-Ser system protein HxsD
VAALTERTLSFERSSHSIDSLQRAAYRMSDKLSADIVEADDRIDVTIHLVDDSGADAVADEFRKEALDQVLRERIRAETEDVRKLALALAFSRTSLNEPASDV